MPWLIRALFVLASVGIANSLSARSMWTDVTGDGLPDSPVDTVVTCPEAPPRYVAPGETAVVDLWIDSESFEFTDFSLRLNVQNAPYIQFGTEEIFIEGCDVQFGPDACVFGGVQCIGQRCAGPHHGVIKILRFQVVIPDSGGNVCILGPGGCLLESTTLSNDQESREVLRGSASRLIADSRVSVAEPPDLTASWGRVEGLFQ